MICDDHDLLIGLFERNRGIGVGEVLAAYKRCAAELVAVKVERDNLVAVKVERDNLVDRLDTAHERIRDLEATMAAARQRVENLIAAVAHDDTEVEAPQ